MNLTISTISLTLIGSLQISHFGFFLLIAHSEFSQYITSIVNAPSYIAHVVHASHGKYALAKWTRVEDLGAETKLGLLILLNGFIYQILGTKLGYDMVRHSKPLCLCWPPLCVDQWQFVFAGQVCVMLSLEYSTI